MPFPCFVQKRSFWQRTHNITVERFCFRKSIYFEILSVEYQQLHMIGQFDNIFFSFSGESTNSFFKILSQRLKNGTYTEGAQDYLFSNMATQPLLPI